MDKLTDEQLISRYFRGDETSLGALVRRYLKPIYVFTYRYTSSGQDADDLTQEVFVRVWKNLKKPAPYRIYSGAGFDPKRGSFKTWIFSIAKNASVDFLKKRKAIPFSQLEDQRGENPVIESIIDPAPSPVKLIEQKDMAGILSGALEKLPAPYRTVLFLKYNDHFAFREIAEILGEPLNTVKSRHRRALIFLRNLLLKNKKVEK